MSNSPNSVPTTDHTSPDLTMGYGPRETRRAENRLLRAAERVAEPPPAVPARNADELSRLNRTIGALGTQARRPTAVRIGNELYNRPATPEEIGEACDQAALGMERSTKFVELSASTSKLAARVIKTLEGLQADLESLKAAALAFDEIAVWAKHLASETRFLTGKLIISRIDEHRRDLNSTLTPEAKDPASVNGRGTDAA